MAGFPHVSITLVPYSSLSSGVLLSDQTQASRCSSRFFQVCQIPFVPVLELPTIAYKILTFIVSSPKLRGEQSNTSKQFSFHCYKFVCLTPDFFASSSSALSLVVQAAECESIHLYLAVQVLTRF